MYMTTKDIAETFGLSHEYVTDKVTKRPDFPKPVVNLSQRLRRWNKAEVERWFTAERQCPPRTRGNRYSEAA